MENKETLEQQDPELSTIEAKINDPKTSWGELTALMGKLDQYISGASVGSQFMKEQAEFHIRLTALKDILQNRINKEEPQEIRTMRHELEALGKDVIANYKEYVRQGEYEKLISVVRRYLEIQYTSQGASEDLNGDKGEKFAHIIDKGEARLNGTSYEQRKTDGGADLAYVYGITDEQAEALYNYVVSAYLSGDNYTKLTVSYILLGLGS